MLFRGVLICFFMLTAESFCSGESHFVKIHEDNCSDLSKGEWMILFSDPDCTSCQKLEPLWEEFSLYQDHLSIRIGWVDIKEDPELGVRFRVKALPTIFHVKERVFRHYEGWGDLYSFFNFVKEKKWLSIHPLSSFLSPQSFLMDFYVDLFRLKLMVWDLHYSLVEDYLLPELLSYAILGLIFAVFGLVGGLMVELNIDIFWRRIFYSQPPKVPEKYQTKMNSSEEKPKNRIPEVSSGIHRLREDSNAEESDTEDKNLYPGCFNIDDLDPETRALLEERFAEESSEVDNMNSDQDVEVPGIEVPGREASNEETSDAD